jgi:hypothetical protein
MKLFISYRRGDSYAATLIHDQIAERFGRTSVVTDVDLAATPLPLAEVIREHITSADVVLVIIGPAWLCDRLADPSDFVRLEIELAIQHGIPVIPVLVGNALLPAAADLPFAMRALTDYQYVEIRAGAEFAGNIARLIQGLEKLAAHKPNDPTDVLLENISSAWSPKVGAPLHSYPPPGTRSRPPLMEELPAPDVFISYRRQGGAETARLIRYELRDRGWRVFLDVVDLGPGDFEQELLHQIERTENFVLVISAGALEGCSLRSDDWLRREIRHAMQNQRHIVPILKEGAAPPKEDSLPDDIKQLTKMNYVPYSHVYYDATIDRMFDFLRPPIGSIGRP